MFTYLKGLLLLVACAAVTSLGAQVLPLEGSVLNYRIIGFTFPTSRAIQKEHRCKLEIAAGNYNNADSFQQHIVKTLTTKRDSLIAEVPSFDKAYTWRVVYGDNTPAMQGLFHHFSTAAFKNVDTGYLRLRITKAATKYKDAYVFLDNNRTLYDMSGQPVWFLPKIDSADNTQVGGATDLKLSPQGTITFIKATDGAYEVDYNGKVLWKAPDNGEVSADTTEHYHHEFTRLANGHYMILGDEMCVWKDTDNAGDSAITHVYNKVTKTYAPGNKIGFPTVIEYDGQGKVVWRWRSSAYFEKLWLYHHHNRLHNFYDDTHANAFFLDEKNQYFYVSFKNINQIIKVKYPEGTVLNNYSGWGMDTDVSMQGKVTFCMQHACKVSAQGDLYFFNNNACEPGARPRIIIAKQPAPGKDDLKEIWGYEYPVEVMANKNRPAAETGTGNKGPVRKLTVGGNVIELPGHDIFASLCEPYSNIFIVSRDKKILWSAVAEKRYAKDKNWGANPQYRASIIKSRRELERLIWNAAQSPLSGGK